MVQQYSDFKADNLHRPIELLEKMAAQGQKRTLKSSAMKTGEQNFFDSDRKGFSLPLQKRIMGNRAKGGKNMHQTFTLFYNVIWAGLTKVCFCLLLFNLLFEKVYTILHTKADVWAGLVTS